MKRWSVVVVLLLLPFTLAPRTSLNPDGADLVFSAVVSRPQIRPGATANVVVQARNATEAVLQGALLEVSVAWDGHADALRLTVPSGCSVAQGEPAVTMTCALRDLAPGQQQSVRIGARPTGSGVLVFGVAGATTMGPVPATSPLTVHVRGS